MNEPVIASSSSRKWESRASEASPAPGPRLREERTTLAIVRDGELLAGCFGVVRRMQMMAVRQVGMMSRLLMRGGAMVLGRVAMMLGGGFVVLGGLIVMLGQQACVHDPLLLCGGRRAHGRIGHKVGGARPVAAMTVP